MIATAVMWYSFAKIFAAEAQYDELEPDSTLPLYLTIGPFLIDAWAYWCLATAVSSP
jgi:hypothetical protein